MRWLPQMEATLVGPGRLTLEPVLRTVQVDERAAVAIRVGLRSRVVIVMASFLGFVAFFWPFLVAPHAFGDTAMAPLMFGALLVLVVAIVFSELADGGIDAKAIAMLGVLSAIGAALSAPRGRNGRHRNRVLHFGDRRPRIRRRVRIHPRLHHSLRLGVADGRGRPWMPYQMFGCAWMGLFARLLSLPLRA